MDESAAGGLISEPIPVTWYVLAHGCGLDRETRDRRFILLAFLVIFLYDSSIKKILPVVLGKMESTIKIGNRKIAKCGVIGSMKIEVRSTLPQRRVVGWSGRGRSVCMWSSWPH
jgi:hypothetical protein